MKYLKKYEKFNLEQLLELIEKEKTYLLKNSKQPTLLNSEKYAEARIKILQYNINKFTYKNTEYGIYITPDDEFISILTELNKTIEPKFPTDFEFCFYIDKNNYNQIDFIEGVPEILRGIGFGYKLYKIIINNIKYITSDRNSNKFAYNIWYNMMLDDNLYCFTSNFKSGIISKKIKNTELKEILNKFINLDVIFDDELNEKIIELYGSLDDYKQKY